jgi:hypothetical protein
MSDQVEAFMSDIAFDDGMGFGLGIGGPSDSAESARKRLAEHARVVRRNAAPGKADEDERNFQLAAERRVTDEIAKTGDALAKAHLEQVLAAIKAVRAQTDAAARRHP